MLARVCAYSHHLPFSLPLASVEREVRKEGVASSVACCVVGAAPAGEVTAVEARVFTIDEATHTALILHTTFVLFFKATFFSTKI
jgi:hypothetical protein